MDIKFDKERNEVVLTKKVTQEAWNSGGYTEQIDFSFYITFEEAKLIRDFYEKELDKRS